MSETQLAMTDGGILVTEERGLSNKGKSSLKAGKGTFFLKGDEEITERASHTLNYLVDCIQNGTLLLTTAVNNNMSEKHALLVGIEQIPGESAENVNMIPLARIFLEGEDPTKNYLKHTLGT